MGRSLTNVTEVNYLKITSPSSVLTGIGIPLTISLWFNPTSGGGIGNYDPVFIARDGSNNGFATIAYGGQAGAKKFAWYWNNSSLDPGTTVTSFGTWYNLVGAQASNGTLTVYVNGTSDGSPANAGGSFTTISNWGIGFDSGFTSRTSNAIFADAAVWNVVLTATEIAALANGARAYTIRPTALKGYWPLDGIQSPEPDLSGNINSFALTGSPALGANSPIMQLTPRMPLNLTGTVAAAAAFQPAWAMRNRIVVEGIGI